MTTRAKRRRALLIVPGAILAGFAAVALIAGTSSGPFDAAVVGTWGEWASALGAVAAVTAALWIVQHEQDAQRARDSEAEAGTIIMNTLEVLDERLSPETRSMEPVPGSGQLRVRLKHYGPVPLRDVKVLVTVDTGRVSPTGDDPDPQVTMTGHATYQQASYSASHLEPKTDGYHWWDFDISDAANPSAVVSWTDRWGQRWRIRPDELPERA